MAYNYCVNTLKGISRTLPRRPFIAEQVFNRIKELNLLKPFRGKGQNVNNNNNTLNSPVEIKVRITNRLDVGQVPIYKSRSAVQLSNLSKVINLQRKPLDIMQNMKVGYFNARSVCNKSNELNDFIVDNRLDICAITETWLTGDGERDQIVCGTLTPNGYKLDTLSRKTGKGGGVAILYKSSLMCKKQKVCKYKSFECIELMLTSGCDSIRLCVIYKPPVGSKHGISFTSFLDEFQQYMDGHATSSGKLLVVGDFNVHMNRDMTDSKHFKDMLYSLNLEQHVKEPTHDKGHLLDLVMSRCGELMPENLTVHAPVFSDHSPITFGVGLQKAKPLKKTITFRKVTDIDITELQKDIHSSDLVTNPKSNVIELVNQYNETLKTVLDKHAPEKVKCVTIHPNTPWFNPDIVEAKQKRRSAERKWCLNKTQINLDLLRQCRCEVNQLCKDAMSSYYRSKIEECGNDTKALYRLTDSLMYKNQNTKLPSHDDPTELANDFVAFFSDKVRKIARSFPIQSDQCSESPNQNVNCLNSFKPITAEELKKLILTGNKKTCLLDPLPTGILIECIDCLLPVLCNIVNSSLISCTMAPCLKTASVTPLLKKTGLDVDERKNYRPVSNLAYVSKLIEKVVVVQLEKHMKENNLEECHQSAYRKQHSTETALLKICNDLLCAMDRSECSLLVLLDQSAAFDTINQDLLLKRLSQSYGIKSDALTWLESYFKNRSQQVVIAGKASDPKHLETGFPQGSILGPFSYPVYTSPLFHIGRSHQVSMHMYADDTQLYLSAKPGDK